MKKTVHFSIDDVGSSFKYIYNNRPESIFDLRLFSQLKEWHMKYGMKVCLYCILVVEDFNITKLPISFKSEFCNNSDWLKFGFHSSNEAAFSKDLNYEESFKDMNRFIGEFGMGQTNTIRVHSWLATNEQENFLKNNGIKTILYPNLEEFHYNHDGVFVSNGIIHRRTDCWLEKMDIINDETLGINNDYLTLFTHEWCFDSQTQKIDRAFKILTENGYVFE